MPKIAQIMILDFPLFLLKYIASIPLLMVSSVETRTEGILDQMMIIVEVEKGMT